MNIETFYAKILVVSIFIDYDLFSIVTWLWSFLFLLCSYFLSFLNVTWEPCLKPQDLLMFHFAWVIIFFWNFPPID